MRMHANQPSAAQREPEAATSDMQRALQRRDLNSNWALATQMIGGRATQQPTGSTSNSTGMPDQLKASLEKSAGFDLSHVRVRANSDKPAKVNALAYAQGAEIHLAPGQHRHLPHEAWHVVQQMQGRVRPTLTEAGVEINDDPALEREADRMGAAMSGVKSNEDQSERVGKRILRPRYGAVMQRVIQLGNRPFQLDQNETEFSALTVSQQGNAVAEHNDRHNIYIYTDKNTFYAYHGGDKSKARTIRSINPQDMKDAKRAKNRMAFYRSQEKVGAPTTSKAFHDTGGTGMLPVWHTMSETGIDKDSVSWSRNPESEQLELFRDKNLTQDQKDEVDQMTMTTIEEEGSGKVHWVAHVGQNPASNFTDTDISSRAKGKRKSSYGGKSLSEFEEDTRGASSKPITDKTDHGVRVVGGKHQLTRGHGIAYEDTIRDIKQKERKSLEPGSKMEMFKKRAKTTDEKQEDLPSRLPAPSMMSPEQYDIGQHGRRTQIEGPMRKQKGSYMEVNKRTIDSGATKGGLTIPGEKIFVKKSSSTSMAMAFNQYSDVYKDKQAAGGWGKMAQLNEIPMSQVPQQRRYESDEEVEFSNEDDAPPTPEMMGIYQQTTRFSTKVELQLGRKLGLTYLGHSDWNVKEELGRDTTGTIEYLLTRTTST